MKSAYPIVITADDNSMLVYIPDFNINTEGSDLANAMFMARDAIGLVGIDLQDAGESVPQPSAVASITAKPGETVTLVDVDFDEYRRMNDQRSVKKNCTLPSWLAYKAEKAGVNFSAVLQDSLKTLLGV